MADTYTQIHIQYVFAVRGRQNLISELWRDRLEKYICGVVIRNKSKPLAIYCNPDHIHLLIGINPCIAISDMARDIKTGSTNWINEHHFITGKFNWQAGFGAFSYSKSQLNSVIKYISRQPIHHQRRNFRDEYLQMLQKAEIDFDEKYLFDWY